MTVGTLAEVLWARAERDPAVIGYESIDASGFIDGLSYGQLAARATALAESLRGGPDGPVVLAYPAGLDYVVAVFAGFLAGRPVIPASPPGTPRETARLSGIVADARPAAMVAPRPSPEFPGLTAYPVPGPEADASAGQRPRAVAPVTAADVAVVQYTSGSTGQPRGVRVRHGSLVANTAAIAERFGLTPSSRGVTWLPPFHDMGLVGGLLTPMWAGIPVRIMAPGDFLKAPLRWLRLISESGATVSGGPNFAYDLCVRRAWVDDALTGLDLSGWQVAFNGGEFVKPRTLAAFAERFAAVGFRPRAFVPCYGLAEATLMVSAGHWSGQSDRVASCGPPVPGQRVEVVDPVRGTPVAEGDEGELWVAGPHITPGYLSGDPADLFGALDSVRFLRTGDLGYLREGEVYVTGRAKDVIVVRGVNIHAVDVEAAAVEAVATVAGSAAAFLVDAEPESWSALVLEVRGRPEAGLAVAVRAAVLAATGLALGLVVLARPGTVPRTSSGKVRRSDCRDALLAGEFDAAVVTEPDRIRELAGRRLRSTVADGLTVIIRGVVAGVCEAGDCGPADRLLDLGLDSLRAAEAAAVLEHALGFTVPLDAVLGATTPAAVADALLDSWLADGNRLELIADRLESAAEPAVARDGR